VARPIPINSAGTRQPFGLGTASSHLFSPVDRLVPQPPNVAAHISTLFIKRIMLVASGLVGIVAVLSATGLWEDLAAARFGLDERDAFGLLAFGVYLLATALYTACTTRLLRNLNRAPWDTRAMAYADLIVGGAVTLTLGVAIMAIGAIFVALAWLGAALLNWTKEG